jgi:drug/metabolite transporter (DMT)-like permease
MLDNFVRSKKGQQKAMSESKVHNPVRIFFYALAAFSSFSIMNVFVKLASDDYTIAQILFFRNALAFIPIFFMISRQGGRSLFKTENHFGHFWRGLVGVGAMFCFFTSFSLLPLADATAFHFTSPLILTALSVPLLGERVGVWRWGAVVIGLLSVAFMLSPNGQANMMGQGIALMAALLAAIAMIFVRKLGRTEHAMTIVFYFTLYSMCAGAIFMSFMWAPLKIESVFFLIMCGLVGGIGQIFLTYAYAHAPAAYVAPFSYVAMVFAVVFDILIWGVWPDLNVVVGSGIIIFSGLFIVYREARKKQEIIRINIYGYQPATPTEKDVKDAS